MANSTKTIKSPGREYIFINLALYMKENLLMELSKEMEDKFSQTVLLIKANSLKEKDLEKEDFNGQMGKFMMVSGRKIENMGVVSGRILKDLHIQVSGKKMQFQGLGSSRLSLQKDNNNYMKDMRGNSLTLVNKDKELIASQTARK